MSRLSSAIRKLRRSKETPAKVLRFYEENRSVKGGFVQSGRAPTKNFVERIKQFYVRANARRSAASEITTWSIIDEKRAPIHSALLEPGNAAFELLCSPEETFLFYGMDNIYPGVDTAHPDIGIIEYDVLERLSESIPIRRAFYDASLLCGHAHKIFDPDKELDAIWDHLGIVSQSIPNPFRNMQGLKTKKGILDYRTLQSIYQAHRIMGINAGMIAEIGGGIGKTAAYCHLMGASRYTIIDIPLTIVAQALFLGLSFGEETVRLPGETENGQTFHLLLPHQFSECIYDVVFNADSMTEMRKQDAMEYANQIKSVGRPFISINHEFNSFTVRDLFGETYHRYPYWMRKGYVEEHYYFSK